MVVSEFFGKAKIRSIQFQFNKCDGGLTPAAAPSPSTSSSQLNQRTEAYRRNDSK